MRPLYCLALVTQRKPLANPLNVNCYNANYYLNFILILIFLYVYSRMVCILKKTHNYFEHKNISIISLKTRQKLNQQSFSLSPFWQPTHVNRNMDKEAYLVLISELNTRCCFQGLPLKKKNLTFMKPSQSKGQGESLQIKILNLYFTIKPCL